MIVGTLRARLLLREARSLKDKRSVVRSIIDRLRNNFNVTVAEIDELDNRQLAVLGIAMVGTESRHLQIDLGEIANLLKSHPVAECLDCQIEV